MYKRNFNGGVYGRLPRNNSNFPNFSSTHNILCVDQNSLQLELFPVSMEDVDDEYVREMIITNGFLYIIIVF